MSGGRPRLVSLKENNLRAGARLPERGVDVGLGVGVWASGLIEARGADCKSVDDQLDEGNLSNQVVVCRVQDLTRSERASLDAGSPHGRASDTRFRVDGLEDGLVDRRQSLAVDDDVLTMQLPDSGSL